MLINRQVIKLVCDAPGCAEEVTLVDDAVLPWSEPMKAWIPNGWVEVNRRTFCSKHDLVLTVDGKEEFKIQ